MATNTTVIPYSSQTSGIAVGDNDQFFRVRDIDPMVHELNSDDGIFYKILSMIPNDAPAINPKYEWAEDDIPPNTTRINFGAGYAANATDIIVDDAIGLVANSIVVNSRTRELIYISSVDYTTNTVTVPSGGRGFAGSAALAILDNDELVFLGDTLPELADANLGNGSLPTAQYNYIQRWSKTFTVSNLQENTEMIDGIGQVPRESLRKMLEMKRQINTALIYGKRGAVASPASAADGYVYTTDGIVNKVQTHELNLGGINGVLSWPVLNHWLKGPFEATSSSPTKALICGQSLFSAITRIAWDRFNFRAQPETSLGTTVTQIVTDEGGVVQVMLDKYGFPTGTSLSGNGVLVDLAHVKLKEMRGEPLAWRQNIQDNDSHVRKDEIWGSASVKISLEETHGVITGAVPQF